MTRVLRNGLKEMNDATSVETTYTEIVEDRFIGVKSTKPLSVVILDVIKEKAEGQFGCSAEQLWRGTCEKLADGVGFRFEELVNIVNLLVKQGKIRFSFGINTSINSIAFHFIN